MVIVVLPRRLLEGECLCIALESLCIGLPGFYGVFAIADQVARCRSGFTGLYNADLGVNT